MSSDFFFSIHCVVWLTLSLEMFSYRYWLSFFSFQFITINYSLTVILPNKLFMAIDKMNLIVLNPILITAGHNNSIEWQTMIHETIKLHCAGDIRFDSSVLTCFLSSIFFPSIPCSYRAFVSESSRLPALKKKLHFNPRG